MIASVAKSFFVALGIACLTFYVFEGIGSDYVVSFLRENIVSLQIGLLAINTATLGVVLTKLRDLVDKGVPASKFNAARKEMLLSIREQVALIVAALSILSVDSAKVLPFTIPSELTRILLITCFVYSIMVLYDTAKSVFVVLGDSES